MSVFYLNGKVAVVVFMLVTSSCFLFDNGDFDNIDFTGQIRWSTDSTGVYSSIHIENVTEYHQSKSETRDFYTDENGYFDFRITIPANALSSQVPEREWLFVVTDQDDEENGLFLTGDTLLIEIDPQHNFSTEFLFDLYVEPMTIGQLDF